MRAPTKVCTFRGMRDCTKERGTWDAGNVWTCLEMLKAFSLLKAFSGLTFRGFWWTGASRFNFHAES